jgi:voltage-gated potassium channel Kch
MWLNLGVGSLMICGTIFIHVAGLLALSRATALAHVMHKGRLNRVLLLTAVVFGLFAIVGLEIWLWALAYWVLQVAENFEAALYLSTITFSTVGYGDVIPAADWRLLAALEGATVFLIIGWSTAYLVTASTRIGPFRSGDHF